MQIQVVLKNFGLSEKEIAVYLALIELGESSVRTISAKAKVNRGTTYDILKSLINMGIISYYNKKSKQYFIAERPETLLTVIEKKRENLVEIKADIEESLPLFKTLFEKQGGKIFIYQSKDDPIVFRSEAEKYQRALPNATVILFGDRGHFTQEELPELIAEIKRI